MRVIYPYVAYTKTSAQKSTRKRQNSAKRNSQKKTKNKYKHRPVHRKNLKKQVSKYSYHDLTRKYPELRLRSSPDLNKMISLV
jgi:hypothetical protein